MKKVLVFFLFLLFSNLSAFEGGGLFSTGLNFDIGTPNSAENPSYINNANKLSLWMKQNIDKECYYNFSAQGSAYLKVRKLIAPAVGKVAIKPILDIDMLKFSFFVPIDKKSNITIEVGRRGLVDSTGIVMSQPFDGIFVRYKISQMTMLSSVAFTGLLNANTVILHENKHQVNKSIYSLPKSYAAIMAMFHIPILNSSYSIDIDTLNFLETKKSGKNKFYLTIGAKGPIINHLFFSTYISGSFVNEASRWNSGILATGAIAYYFNKYNAKAGLHIQYAKGGKNNFQTFTLRHVSSQFFSPYSNVWNTGVKMSIKPLRELYLQALCNIICKGEKDAGSLYRGFEWQTQASYTIKRDISVEASLGQFIQKNGNIQTFFGIKGLIAF